MTTTPRDEILEFGPSGAGVRMLRVAALLEAGDDIEPEDRAWLALTLKELAAAATPKRPRGRPPMTGTQGERWFNAVWQVETLHDQGMRVEDALNTVCQEFHLMRDTLVRHRKELREHVRRVMSFIAAEERRVEGQDARAKKFCADLNAQNARFKSLAGRRK